MGGWDDLELEALAAPGAGGDPRVLVAVVPTARDWALVQREGWYRLPVARAPARVGADYLAFYLTRRASPEGCWAVSHYAAVRAVRLARRCELLPEEPDHPRAQELYYRYALGPLQELPSPVRSARLRRVTFIPTTLSLLLSAREIGALWERPAGRRAAQRLALLRQGPAPAYAA